MIRASISTTVVGAIGMVAGEAASAANVADAIIRGFAVVFGMGLGGSIVVWLLKREVQRIDRGLGDHEERIRRLEGIE